MKDTAEEQPVEEKSLNEELAEALKAQETDTSEDVEEPEEEIEEEPEEEEEDASEEPSHDEERPENDDEPDEEDDQESESDEIEAIEAPQHWAPADRERFQNLPKEAQEFVLDRHKSMEADYTRKTQEIAAIRKRGEALDEVIAPYRSEFQLSGMDDTAAIRQLFSVHDYLKRDPNNAIQWLAQTYGADLNAPQQEVDPAVRQLEQRINQMHQEQQSTLQAQQEQQQQALVNQIKAFEEEKDEGGSLKHPHFQEVYDDMVALLQMGKSSDLEDAYNQAVAMNPNLHQATLKQKEEQAKKQEKAEKAKQAKRAKKAASGVKSSGASVKKEQPQSLRDEIAGLVNQQLNQ